MQSSTCLPLAPLYLVTESQLLFLVAVSVTEETSNVQN